HVTAVIGQGLETERVPQRRPPDGALPRDKAGSESQRRFYGGGGAGGSETPAARSHGSHGPEETRYAMCEIDHASGHGLAFPPGDDADHLPCEQCLPREEHGPDELLRAVAHLVALADEGQVEPRILFARHSAQVDLDRIDRRRMVDEDPRLALQGRALPEAGPPRRLLEILVSVV